MRLLTLTVLFWLSSFSEPCHLFPCCCSHIQRCLDLSFTMFFLLRLSEQLDSTCVRGRPASLISLRQKRCFPSAHFLVLFQVLHPSTDGGFRCPEVIYSVDMSSSLEVFSSDYPTYRLYFKCC